jgi:hypothetical protein
VKHHGRRALHGRQPRGGGRRARARPGRMELRPCARPGWAWKARLGGLVPSILCGHAHAEHWAPLEAHRPRIRRGRPVWR